MDVRVNFNQWLSTIYSSWHMKKGRLKVNTMLDAGDAWMFLMAFRRLLPIWGVLMKEMLFAQMDVNVNDK